MKFFPGITRCLPIEQYHAMTDSISKSGLDKIEQAPFIYYARTLDPKRPPAESKSGQLEGSLAHCAILEPDEFDSRYLVGPDWNRNTNKWKEFAEAVAVETPGVVIIKQEQYDIAWRQAEQMRALPEVGDLFSSGNAEVSAFWRDADTGVACRCRPDFVHNVNDESVLLLDVKTFSDPSPKEFARQCGRKFYAKQDAFYSDGYAIASKKNVLGFIFVAVSSEYPYAAAAIMLDDDSREAGRQHYKRNLHTYAECLRTNTWPGFSTDITIVRLPQWALVEGD